MSSPEPAVEKRPEPAIAPDSKRLRLFLGLSLTVAWASVVLPLVVVLAVFFEAVLLVGETVAIGHAGSYEPGPFATEAHAGFRIASMIVAGALTLAFINLLQGRPAPGPRKPGWFERHPLYTVTIVLAPLTAIAARGDWDSHGYDRLSGTLLVAAWWYFGLLVPPWLLISGTKVLLLIYRAARRSVYRIGFTTGAATILSLAAIGYLAAQVGEFRQIRQALIEASGRPPTHGGDTRAALQGLYEELEGVGGNDAQRALTAAPLGLPPGPPTGSSDDKESFAACAKDIVRRGTYKQTQNELRRDYPWSDADEALQDGLMAACQHCSKHPCLDVAPYFVQCARHAAIDLIRARSRSSDRDVEEVPADESCNRFNRLDQEAARRARVLRRAMEDETPRDRAIIRMKVLQGRSFYEIGVEFSISEVQARARFRHAKDRIAARLKRACPDEEW